MEVVVMKGAGNIEVEVVMPEMKLVMIEVGMGLLKKLVVFALGFSDISAWFFICRIKRVFSFRRRRSADRPNRIVLGDGVRLTDATNIPYASVI